MQVLVADDDLITLELVSNALSLAGYSVDVVGDGLEALARIRAGQIRLVLADWDMPGMSGPDLCRAIRRDPSLGYVYIILITSHEGADRVVEGLSAGADDFISKPFHPAELIARTRTGERVVNIETRDLVIFALAKLSEHRDPETGRHLERVRQYCRILTAKLAESPDYKEVIDPEYIRLVWLTSPLHDIGKVAIPDRILNKPGRLTAEEFELMKTHARVGAETLEATLEKYPNIRFLEIARDIAATHHERFDGAGYPAGLRGHDIPLCGRIVAVADVYDALTSRRPYKEAMSHDEARKIIIENSGTQFDPDVVDAFVATESEFLAICRETHEEPIHEALPLALPDGLFATPAAATVSV